MMFKMKKPRRKKVTNNLKTLLKTCCKLEFKLISKARILIIWMILLKNIMITYFWWNKLLSFLETLTTCKNHMLIHNLQKINSIIIDLLRIQTMINWINFNPYLKTLINNMVLNKQNNLTKLKILNSINIQSFFDDDKIYNFFTFIVIN